MKNSMWLRAAATAAGAVALVSLAGVAVAADESYGTDDVQITTEIEPRFPGGTLALSVDPGEAALTEQQSTSDYREFTGTLPTVTVTDTRPAADIAEGSFWYVTGSSSDFTGTTGQPAITPDHLGWTPRVIDGDAGEVSAGDQVDTVLDDTPDNRGLVSQEFLVNSFDPANEQPIGSWSATADLFLRTPLNVAPGSYAATLTLSLFEGGLE